MHLDLPTLIFVSFLAAISAAIGFTSLMLVLRGQAAQLLPRLLED